MTTYAAYKHDEETGIDYVAISREATKATLWEAEGGLWTLNVGTHQAKTVIHGLHKEEAREIHGFLTKLQGFAHEKTNGGNHKYTRKAITL